MSLALGVGAKFNLQLRQQMGRSGGQHQNTAEEFMGLKRVTEAWKRRTITKLISHK